MSRKTLIFTIILIITVGILLNTADESLEVERLENLEKAIHKSAVACYAIEGFYPADIEYLRENYGLMVDEGRYTVIYDAFASNILPEITVIPHE